MVKDLQKTADFYRKKKGILDPEQFDRALHIHYFEPAPNLLPFVAHYFVARWDMRDEASYNAANVLSQPAIHIVFTAEGATIQGVGTSKRTIVLKGSGVYAGVRFKPGGFYYFWKKPIAEMAEKSVALTHLFPQADTAFTKKLLSQNDDHIAEQIDQLMQTSVPAPDEKIMLIGDIIDAIDTQPGLHTTQAVAKAFAISERTLQHLFTTYVGVGVKWVIMRTRFLQAVQHAHELEKPNWTNVAAELGYSTQSHFINDFKKLVGLSPSNYIKTITSQPK